MGEELGIVGERGGGGEQRVAPRGKQGEIEARDVAETVRDHDKVASVASEGEGGARGLIELEKLVAYQGEGVAGAGVGD